MKTDLEYLEDAVIKEIKKTGDDSIILTLGGLSQLIFDSKRKKYNDDLERMETFGPE